MKLKTIKLPTIPNFEIIEIKNDKDFEKVVEKQKEIKSFKKQLEDQQDLVLKPLKEAMTNYKNIFKEPLAKLLLAEEFLKVNINKYYSSKKEKEEEEKQKILDTISESDDVNEQIEKFQKIEASPIKKIEGLSFKTYKDVEIVDISIIPKEYFVLDMVKIKEDAVKNNIVIPGVKVIEKTISSIRS